MSARKRATFHFSEEPDIDPYEVLDEEQQENLISAFKHSDELSNTVFKVVLSSCFSILAAIWFWQHGLTASLLLNSTSFLIGLGTLWMTPNQSKPISYSLGTLNVDLRAIYAAMGLLSGASFYYFRAIGTGLHPYQNMLWSILSSLQTALIIASNAAMASTQEDIELLDQFKYVQKGA
ncbi:hypothetical protein DSO57_1001377 [Entomophthora muscae]|uniref:Uncharacterized protein n=1 Tax=Entomophthora muscae TaxID=34485 RepID=A0ACC2SXY7_9FUNG|nr:hypothetical protein DSO57_1001377 [Entomophthora muscae]